MKTRSLVCAAMMAVTPFVSAQAAPNWYKGNMHTHTLWSDGQAFPEQAVDDYQQRGYHFLALTEHNRLQEGEKWVGTSPDKVERYRQEFGDQWVEQRPDGQVRLKTLAEYRDKFEQPDQFLLIQSEELTDSEHLHLNAHNLDHPLAPLGGETAGEKLNRDHQLASQAADLVVINHPNYHYTLNASDLIQLRTDEPVFFEAYNGHWLSADAGDANHASTEKLWDQALVGRLCQGDSLVYGLATDDAHDYHRLDPAQSNPGRGWVMVEADELSANSLMAAMKDGQFYSSTGVELAAIESFATGMQLTIKPTPGVEYSTQFIGSRGGQPAEVLAIVEGTEPGYHFAGDELYLRAKVSSSQPKENSSRPPETEAAWIQPIEGPGASLRCESPR
ncbi:MAG: histidinol-phosphatase [Vulcanimicrobiota bacterium]